MNKNKLTNENLNIAGAGVGLGGVLTIIYYLLVNWYNFNEISKLVVSGSALAILICASCHIFNKQITF